METVLELVNSLFFCNRFFCRTSRHNFVLSMMCCSFQCFFNKACSTVKQPCLTHRRPVQVAKHFILTPKLCITFIKAISFSLMQWTSKNKMSFKIQMLICNYDLMHYEDFYVNFLTNCKMRGLKVNTFKAIYNRCFFFLWPK